jgi:hypothetical protein
MKILLCSLFIFLLALPVCTDAISRDMAGIADETRLLESEFILARKPNIYFIFDLKNDEVLLKARGIVLKKMKIEDVNFWGRHVDARPKTMLKKSALFKEPKRVNIDPNKAKEEETSADKPANTTPGTFDIDALELKDMPTVYHLEFNDGIFISVRPKSAGFVSKLYAIANYAMWYASRPILTVWHSITGRPYTSIYLTLSEEDARSVYWSLEENSENIIFQP